MNENKIFSVVMDTPMPGCRLGLRICDERLVAVAFLSSGTTFVSANSGAELYIVNQFQSYFEERHWQFDIDLFVQGTDFQKRVWQALIKIPAGEVRRYGELADLLDSSARAVGNACRINPLPIIIPCHRVIAAAGIGGFMGQRSGGELDIKRWLLRHESARQ